MARGSTLAVVCLVVVVSVGCVTVSPAAPTAGATDRFASIPGSVGASPTEAPSTAPSSAPATADSMPSAVASITSQPSASGVASAGAVASASAEPQQSSLPPGTGFHADTRIFDDDFSDASSGWGIADLAPGTLRYRDEAFVIEFAQGDNSLWSRRAFGATWDVLRVSGSVDIGSADETGKDGAAGWMCGSEADDYVGGLVNTAGEWIFFSIDGTDTMSLARGLLPERESDGRYELTVECAGTVTGAMRLRLLVANLEVAVFERGDAGLPTFDRAAVYADTADARFVATFDDAQASGGSAFGGFPGATPQAVSGYDRLLYDLPGSFAEDCRELPPEDPTIVAQARCIPAEDAAEAHYMLFEDGAARDAFFEASLADMDDLPDQGSCREGPFAGRFSIFQPGGQGVTYELACYVAADSRLHVTWTDPLIPIIGEGVLVGDDFAALYEWWLRMGPAS